MSTRLTQSMYDVESDSEDHLFNLRSQQIRPKWFMSNPGWYNGKGERLGRGDLDSADIQRIESGLEEGEVFIILPQIESHWAFKIPGPFIDTTGLKEENPGIEYVLKHARYIIAKGERYVLRRESPPQMETKPVQKGITFKVISRDEARLILEGKPHSAIAA